MQKCLGIYIENNLIKYAKVSKEKKDVKVDSFGIRFFENLGEEIKKIVEETFSFGTPICVNLSNEKYLYFDVFSLLNKKDIEKTVQTEFEAYCEERKYNKNAFETRYALTPKDDDKDKIKAINIFVNKIELNRQLQAFDTLKVSKVVPVSIAIGNIAKIDKKENQLIVNMEETTTITTVVNKQVYNVETMEVGSAEVLNAINKIENSYSKAYEICKNTTIYTADVIGGEEEQPYLQYIMPTVYKIAQRVQEIATQDSTKIQTVYLTGTLASVNNIDLYFQEFLPNIECKILKPDFIDETTMKINVKDYIEVNSAIALAVSGASDGVQELNFKKVNASDRLSQIFKKELGEGKVKTDAKSLGGLNLDFSEKLDDIELWLARGIIAFMMIATIYIIFSGFLVKQMDIKKKEIEKNIGEQKSQISAMETNAKSLDSKTETYISLTSDLKKTNEKMSDIAARRNCIPNLLNQIMYVIPEKLQLVSIDNTTEKSVTIVAKSDDYDQIGYFITALKTKKILSNVVSSSGITTDGVIVITIEGELP